MLSSYNDFKHNVYRDALIISVTDTFTSLLAGATTFSIMGYLSEEMGVENVADVLKGGGTTLAFVTYPDVITHLGWYPQVFACFFFLMLFTLGMGSATALTGVVITVVCDNFPRFNRFRVTIVVCFAGFLLGLFYVTPQGQFILELVDSYLGEDAIYILAILEVISVQWIYGYNNFVRDIEFMIGIKTGIYWKFCWLFFVPFSLVGILTYSFIRRTPM
ncbi:UNVERIFIED_CONTAM: hypothetical protein GTU68_053849, partial [Idotea baltica]|nr:hypothetical protein [Idotea baltica]